MNITDVYTSQYQSTQMKAIQGEMAKSPGNKALYSACQDFESLFIKQMLDSMKKTLNGAVVDGVGFGKEIYEDMLYNEYAQKIAKTARLGIAEMLYKQMIK